MLLNPIKVKNLDSNIITNAFRLDNDLVNAWGVVFNDDTVWVADNGTGLITAYTKDGRKLRPRINVVNSSGSPTGLIKNKTKGFKVSNGFKSKRAFLITATENGTINAYTHKIDPLNAITVVDNSSSGTIYKGLAIANDHLFATDFHNNKIDTFDNTFTQVTGYPFIDPNLPAGYAPFNIVHIFGLLFVTYAKPSPPQNKDNLSGPGLGFINIFNTLGVYIRRLVQPGGYLNAPWALIEANKSLNLPNESILVGNFGDGYINAFDFNGTFLGQIKDSTGVSIQTDGLWGLANSKAAKIYVTSGPNSEVNGLLSEFKIKWKDDGQTNC